MASLTGDSDEDDDFLSTAKDQNIFLTLEESQDTEDVEEPHKTQSKKKKPLTKYAVVKKLLKKDIQMNTRVVFDEEGEEILDPRKQQVINDHVNFFCMFYNITDEGN